MRDRICQSATNFIIYHAFFPMILVIGELDCRACG